MKKFCIVLLFTFLLLKLQAQWNASVSQAVSQVGFIENRGQIISGEEILYQFQSARFCLNLKRQGFSYEFFTFEKAPVKFNEASGIIQQERIREKQDALLSYPVRRSCVEIVFLHCNPEVHIIAAEQSGPVLNYYLQKPQSCHTENVRGFKKITYENIYEDIDLVFYADGPILKYEFVVRDGGKAKDIQMEYRGSERLSINTQGELLIETAGGFVTETSPYCYESLTHQSIACSYSLNKNALRYEVKKSPNGFVIDPNIIWGTYFGNIGNDESGEVDFDPFGNPILAGQTSSTSGLVSAGAYQSTFAGGESDTYLAKFDSTGKLLWCTYFGGDSAEVVYSVKCNSQGDIYLMGATNSVTGIATAGAYQQNFSGGKGDMLLAKFSDSGNLLWATYGGYSGEDQIRSGAFDSDENLLTTGYTTSDTAISTPGAFLEDAPGAGGGDAYVIKWSPQGEKIWGTYFGGPSSDRAHSITTDPAGNIFLAGTTQSTSGIATAGTAQTIQGGDIDLFVTKLDPAGFQVWGSYLGGEKEDRGRGIVTDQFGSAYIAGYTYSENNIATAGAFQTNWAEAYNNQSEPIADGLIARFNPTGQIIWSTYYGDTGDESVRVILLDEEGNVLFGGSSQSNSVVATPDGFQPLPSTAGNGFLASFDPFGNRIWGSYFSRQSDCTIDDFDFNIHGDLYITGTAQRDSFYITANAWQTQFYGNATDVYLTRFNARDVCYDNFESNDDFTTASSITPSMSELKFPYSANISHSSDLDWYRFQNTDSLPYFSVMLTSLPADYDMILYSQNGEAIRYSLQAGLEDELILNDDGAIETFYVRVSGKSGAYDAAACYQLSVLLTEYPSDAYINSLKESRMFLYPNPSGGELNVLYSLTDQGEVEFSIYNTLGSLVYETTLEGHVGRNYEVLEISQLTNGHYMIQLKQGIYSDRKSLIVAH